MPGKRIRGNGGYMTSDIKNILRRFKRLNLSSYEWRILAALGEKMVEEGKLMCAIKLDELHKETQIQKGHITRTIRLLEQKNILLRTSLPEPGWTYYRLTDPKKWRSKITKEPAPNEKEAKLFQEFMGLYPNDAHEDDARPLFLHMIRSGVDPDRIINSVKAYLEFGQKASQKKDFSYEAWEKTTMYPTSFLNGRWKEFLKWKKKNELL
jgi:DNA-binding transcriptional ArsR family regulator